MSGTFFRATFSPLFLSGLLATPGRRAVLCAIHSLARKSASNRHRKIRSSSKPQVLARFGRIRNEGPAEFAQLGCYNYRLECNFARRALTPVKARLVRRVQ